MDARPSPSEEVIKPSRTQISPVWRADLSVIIVNWNTRDLLVRCLESVYNTIHDLSFEVMVVDNASSDDSGELVPPLFPLVNWIQNDTNVGFARANNQAIKSSTGRCLLLLNSDAAVQEGAIQRIVRFIDETRDAGLVGVKLLNPDGSFQASFGDFPGFLAELATAAGLDRLFFGRDFPSHSEGDSNEVRSVDWVGGACIAARRAALAQVGLLDEDYFMYSEEVNWCYRFKEAGWKVYFLPSARVVHWKGQSSMQADDLKLVWLHQGRMRFYAAHHHPALSTLLWTCTRVIAVMKAAFWLITSLFSGRRRAFARRKARANWRVATLSSQELT